MKFCVDIREKNSGNTIFVALETESHDEAYKLLNEYNKCYDRGIELRKRYPLSEYFADVYNDEI